MEILIRTKALHIVFALLLYVTNNAIVQGCNELRNHLLFARPHSIKKVDPKDLSKEPYASSPSPISISYDFKRNALVWSDMNYNIYSQADNVYYKSTLVSIEENWSPFSISIDSVNDKLYVADTFTSTVQILDLKDLTKRGIVVGSNVWNIKVIALDPNEGYLFILDENQILRTDLDGSNQKVIYCELFSEGYSGEVTIRDSLHIQQITLDLKAKRLYWINSKRGTSIESSDYNGENRIIHYKDENSSLLSSYSLTHLNGVIYWVNTRSEKLFKYDLEKNILSVLTEDADLLFVKAIECEQQQIENSSCDTDNGGCQHFCLLSKGSKESVKCSCNIGYQLDKDGKSCVSPSNFLLITQNNLLRGKSLNSNGYIEAEVIDPSKFELGYVFSLDFDVSDRIILISSTTPKDQLHVVQLDNGEKKILLQDLSKHAEEITYDWITKNIYYFTYDYSDKTTLSVMNVRNPTYSKILIEDGEWFVLRRKAVVRAITIHPNRGYIYYTEMVKSACTVSRINTDGTALKILKKTRSPNLILGLAVDYNHDRIYYTESYLKKDSRRSIRIRHCDLDGQDIQDLLKIDSPEGELATITINEDWLYLNTGSILYRLNIRNGGEPIILIHDMEMSQKLSNIKVFSNTGQTTASGHPCRQNANNCQKFCFAVPDFDNGLKGICGCPDGETLGQDGKSCVPCTRPRYKCKISKASVQRNS